MTPEHEIYALKYAGPLTSSGALLLWLREWETTEIRYYYFWCILGGEQPIVVDCGVSPEVAKQKNLPGYVVPSDVLKRIGIDAAEIKHVILTHLHWDHASGVELFPNATFYVQQKEFDFWLSDPLAKRPPFARFPDENSNMYLTGLKGTDRLFLVDGDTEIRPGITLLSAPGHSPWLQAVAVNTAKGTAIIGSDSASSFRSYKEDWPSCIMIDLAASLKTYDKLRSKVSSLDLVFPGHDRRMLEYFPKVAEDITKLV
jgi:glyoxylase-like metal-dependent hydrolase (beta-lactamase superfamily II)